MFEVHRNIGVFFFFVVWAFEVFRNLGVWGFVLWFYDVECSRRQHVGFRVRNAA